MPISRIRPGLSFELAPSVAVHPLRTDVACMVGTVARRRRGNAGAAELQALPEVLLRWLLDNQIDQVGGAPVRRLRVSLQSVAQFIDSLLALESGAARAALAQFLQTKLTSSSTRPTAEALLQDCRELTPLPEALVEDLRLRGLHPRGLLGSNELLAWRRVQRLHNLPVALENFEAFDALFAWDRRGIRNRDPHAGEPTLATPLGVAVRAFFGEGGRRVYIVRSGDPGAAFDSATDRLGACFPPATADRSDRCAQLPGVRADLPQVAPAAPQPAALSAADWVGLEHVYGLADVNFALLPDLVHACAQTLPAQLPPPEVVAAPEVFAECVDDPIAADEAAGRRLAPPRLDADGLDLWRRLLNRALVLLDNNGRAFHRRDIQLLASLPLTINDRDIPVAAAWMPWMVQAGWLTLHGAHQLLSDRLQLAYPWLRTGESADAQGGIEAPEGSLAGVLARSAMERGSFRSAALQPVSRMQDSEPVLAWSQALQQTHATPLGELTLAQRVCLIGPTPRGPQLLSDVGCSEDARTRQAAVRRLVNVIIQAARNAGDEFSFEPSGEALWARVRARLSDLMRALLAGGALSSDGLPFAVRCGRDTMQQNDIDAGRLIAQIEFQPAQPIQRILVVLNLRDAPQAQSLALAA